jgi:hypothetical protein
MLKYKFFLEIQQMEPGCSMEKGGKTGKQTDMTKLIVAFRISVKVFKNCMKGHKA